MSDEGIAFNFGLLVGAAVSAVLMFFAATSDWRNDLIGRGLAQYCPDDGAFAYVGECGE
jgi:hypothetical protein